MHRTSMDDQSVQTRRDHYGTNQDLEITTRALLTMSFG